MPDQTAGATPAAESAATATPTQAAPPAGVPTRTQPRTSAEFLKAAAASLRGESTQPTTQEPPNAEAAQESPAEADPEAPDALSKSAHASPTDAPEGDADDTESDPDGTDQQHQRWPKPAVERLKKVKAQRNQLRERVKELESLLAQDDADPTTDAPSAQGKATKTASTAAGNTAAEPLANLTDRTEIQRAVEDAQANVDLVDDLLTRLLDDPADVERKLRDYGVNLGKSEEDWSASKMRDYLREARKQARATVNAGPKRLEYVQREETALREAVKLVPELAQENSEERKQALEILQRAPYIRQDPNWAQQVAIYLVGWREVQKRQGATNGDAGAAKPEAATAQPKPVTRPPRAPGAPRSAPGNAQPDPVDEARRSMREQKGGAGMNAYALAAVRRALGQ